ncbi:hypothetical protein IL306_011556 [Fusarium sp. DS 682]|nr:hypothetical protein IL306_011556 [Fusarium sp. DS 682]
MGYTRDADGLAVPPTPASTVSHSCRVGDARASSYPASVASSDLTGTTPSSGRSSGTSLVEDPLYRLLNLAANNIYMRPLREQFLDSIADLVDDIRRDPDSPGPSLDEVAHDPDLNELWSDIIENYGDSQFPMQLRMFAEAVYGQAPGGTNGTAMRQMMVAMEHGRAGGMHSHKLLGVPCSDGRQRFTTDPRRTFGVQKDEIQRKQNRIHHAFLV